MQSILKEEASSAKRARPGICHAPADGKQMEKLSLKARLYLWAVGLLGIAAVVTSLMSWESTGWFRFLSYCALFAIASGLKVWLPGINGTMSMNFVFVLLAVLELSLAEAVVMVSVGTLVQMFWRAEHLPNLTQGSFNAANMVVAMSAAYNAYHGSFLAGVTQADLVRLAAAATLFFTLNTMSVSTIIGLTESSNPLKIWTDCYLWSFPYYLVGAALSFGVAYSNREFGWLSLLFVLPALAILYKSFHLYFSRLEAESAHAKEMAALHLRTIEALAAAIEAKDAGTHDHLERVQVYAVEMARALGLDEVQINALRAASILHDIGKLAVPEHIISKPGRLTREEFEKMKIHPVVGADILRRVDFPYPVVPIVLHHHEKWDGSGYPDGLAGEEIPIAARIISVIDCLDALTFDRPYRRALPLDEAMSIVRKESDRSYDPNLVRLLEENYHNWETLARQIPKIRESVEVEISVERGIAPAAGLQEPDPRNETASRSAKIGKDDSDFVSQIAAARQEVQALYELSLDLGSSLSVEETMSVLDIRLSRLITYDTIAVYTLTDGALSPDYVSGHDREFFASLRIPLGEGLAGWVAEQRKPILNGSPAVEAGYLTNSSRVSTLRSALAIPLVHLEQMVGVIALYSRARSAFREDDSRVLAAVAPKLAVALDNILRFRKVEDKAATDALTGLPNAHSLFVQLDKEINRSGRTGKPLGVFVCDLDCFKQVNDQFGHLVGNQLLQLIAKRLLASFREYDYVARMGGDEFVALVPDIDGKMAERKGSELTRVVENAGLEVCGEHMVSVSVGVACYPEDGATAEDLLGLADERMYEHKRVRKEHAVSGGLQRIAVAVRRDRGTPAPAFEEAAGNGEGSLDELPTPQSSKSTKRTGLD